MSVHPPHPIASPATELAAHSAPAAKLGAVASAAAAPPALASRSARPRRIDPRWFQIAALSSLLAYGVLGLHFEISPAYVPTLLAAALATQWAGARLARRGRFDPLSAV